MTRPYITALTLFVILLSPLQAMASELIGTVMAIEGEATRRDAASRDVGFLKENELIYLYDEIKTRADTKVHILFVDDTQITLGEKTEFVVDRYIFEPEDESKSIGQFNILKGTFLFVSGLLSKTEKPDVRIQTGYGTIGIRGTTVWGGPINGEYGVLVSEGEVSLRNHFGHIKLTTGQGSFIRGKRTWPRKLTGWSPDTINRALETITLQNTDKLKEKVAIYKKRNAELRPFGRERMQQLIEKKGVLEKMEKRHDEKVEELKEKAKEKMQKKQGKVENNKKRAVQTQRPQRFND